MEDEKIEKLSVERQKYQMHKQGYSDIVKAISDGMNKQNELLKELINKIVESNSKSKNLK